MAKHIINARTPGSTVMKFMEEDAVEYLLYADYGWDSRVPVRTYYTLEQARSAADKLYEALREEPDFIGVGVLQLMHHPAYVRCLPGLYVERTADGTFISGDDPEEPEV